MTIEGVIQRCKEQAATLRTAGDNGYAEWAEWAAQHEQLAGWLEELLEKRCKVIVQANRINELEAEVQEQLTKRAEAYNKLYDAYAKIENLLKQQAK